MKTIKYNNKEYKLPFDVALPDDPTAEVEVKNDESRWGPEYSIQRVDNGQLIE